MRLSTATQRELWLATMLTIDDFVPAAEAQALAGRNGGLRLRVVAPTR